MKERPFYVSNVEDIRAILDGAKTKDIGAVELCHPKSEPLKDHSSWRFIGKNESGFVWENTSDPINHVVAQCPLGEVGERLWVKESWKENKNKKSENYGGYEYAANYDMAIDIQRWKSPMSMPRKASRILLEITSIELVRLQFIDSADIRGLGAPTHFPNAQDRNPLRRWFIGFWDSLPCAKKYPWNSNPWVWIVSYKVVGDEKD